MKAKPESNTGQKERTDSGRLHKFVMRFKAWQHRRLWEYGTFKAEGMMARRHRIKRNVQFVLWMPGEQGHKKPYWHDSDSSWWPSFKCSGVLCVTCEDSKHVCENHPSLPWEGTSNSTRVCKCGGAGMPCPECY